MAKSKETKDKHFLKKPYYEGGVKALKQFISENLKYPKEALEQKVEGTVHVRYTINYKGKVISAKVISGIGHACDEEAMRLVKLLEFQLEKPRGIRVQFHKNIKIHFRVPKQPVKKVLPQNTNQSVQYTYTTTSTKTSPRQTPAPVKKKKSGYTITVNY